MDKLVSRQSELIRIVEAIDAVLHSKDWQELRGMFETRVESLEKLLLVEAKKSPLEPEKIYFLQGQIAEIKRYDLATYAESCKKELQGIKLNLQ